MLGTQQAPGSWPILGTIVQYKHGGPLVCPHQATFSVLIDIGPADPTEFKAGIPYVLQDIITHKIESEQATLLLQ